MCPATGCPWPWYWESCPEYSEQAEQVGELVSDFLLSSPWQIRMFHEFNFGCLNFIRLYCFPPWSPVRCHRTNGLLSLSLSRLVFFHIILLADTWYLYLRNEKKNILLEVSFSSLKWLFPHIVIILADQGFVGWTHFLPICSLCCRLWACQCTNLESDRKVLKRGEIGYCR